MDVLHLDIETYSDENIKSTGLFKYAQGIQFEVLLLAYAFNDEPIQDISITEGEPIPDRVLDVLLGRDKNTLVFAHNSLFEWYCLSTHLGQTLDIKRFRCTMAMAAQRGLPLSLEQLSKALKLRDDGKMKEGKDLIKLFCIPCKPTKKNNYRTRNFPKDMPEKWTSFRLYVRRDVSAERKAYKLMILYPSTRTERDMFLLDQIINARGVLIDVEFAAKMDLLHREIKVERRRRLKEITGLENPNSIPQLRTWLADKGYTSDKLDAAVRKEMYELAKIEGEETVIEALELKAGLSKTSNSKYKKMLECSSDLDGRARGTLVYAGAMRTGRWAGRLIQMQNLPRNYIKDLDGTREDFKRLSLQELQKEYDNVPNLMSQLIRTALIAPEGKVFAPCDFSAIEARVIAWLAQEKWRLEVFRTHGKIYEASASLMFSIPIELIKKGTDYEHYRAKGKVSELALGFQGSVGALKLMGGKELEAMGLVDSDLKMMVDSWRSASPNIVNLWYSAGKAAVKAIKTGKRQTFCGKGMYYKYDGLNLTLTLPSGRRLFYPRARLIAGKYGPQIAFLAVKNGRQCVDTTYGGKLVENMVQAIARDLLVHAMLEAHKNKYRIVFHVHDEMVPELDIEGAQERLKELEELMSVGPDWAGGLPLNADGYITKYYKKD